MHLIRSLSSTVPTTSLRPAYLCTRITAVFCSFLSFPIALAYYPIQRLLGPVVKDLHANIAQEGKPVDYSKYGPHLSAEQDVTSLATPVKFPNGQLLANRLVKAGITDGLCTPDGNPTLQMIKAYQRYAQGGYGMIISPDTSVDRRCRLPGATGHTPIFDSLSDRQAFTNLAQTIKEHGAKAVLQLTHPGPVVPFSDRAVAPSLLLADNPRSGITKVASPLTDLEIASIFTMFLRSARQAEECQFDGIQLVASNGYLPALFLNPRINTRSGQWAGNAFVISLLKQLLDQRTNPSFTIGIKINSADLQAAGLSTKHATQLVEEIGKLRVDFIEIGGGNCERIFEQGDDNNAVDNLEREAFFVEFAKGVVQSASLNTPLMTTGEWRNPVAMNLASHQHGNLLIGLGRSVCLDPEIGRKILGGEVSRIPNWFSEHIPPFVAEKLREGGPEAKRLSHGIEMVWHGFAVGKVANGEENPAVVGIFDKPQNALAARIHMLTRAIMPLSLLSPYFQKPPLSKE